MNDLYQIAQQIYAEGLGLFTLTTSIASLRLSFSFSTIAHYATCRRQWHRDLDARALAISRWHLVRLLALAAVLVLSIYIFFQLLGLLGLYDYLTQARPTLDIHIQQFVNRDLGLYKQRIFIWAYAIFILVLFEFLVYSFFSWRERRFDDHGQAVALASPIAHIYSTGTDIARNPKEAWMKFYLSDSDSDQPQIAVIDDWKEWSALLTRYKRKYSKGARSIRGDDSNIF